MDLAWDGVPGEEAHTMLTWDVYWALDSYLYDTTWVPFPYYTTFYYLATRLNSNSSTFETSIYGAGVAGDSEITKSQLRVYLASASTVNLDVDVEIGDLEFTIEPGDNSDTWEDTTAGVIDSDVQFDVDITTAVPSNHPDGNVHADAPEMRIWLNLSSVLTDQT